MQRIIFFERQVIEVGLRRGKSHRAIAKSLYRDHRVIDREVSRNKGEQTPYIAIVAQRIADAREKKRTKKKLEKAENAPLRNYVIERLKDDWSPEEIAGILEKHKPQEAEGKTISHESIYRYIYEGEGRYEHLYPHLRKGRSKRQKRKGRTSQKTRIPERISIHERSREINERRVYGHWESDTMEGTKRDKVCVSAQFERKTKFVRLHKIMDKSAEETDQAIRKSIDEVGETSFQSITFDNGTEGAKHATLRDDFDIATYHCDPYASWQKGGVENVLGLVRQYIPKKTKISTLTDEEIYAIQEKLNNRPRKSLNYLTPNQVLAQEMLGGALDT